MHRSLFLLLVSLQLLAPGRAQAPAAPTGAAAAKSAYDPLAVPDAATVVEHTFVVQDRKRQREVPIRVYLPAATEPAPVVLFSHGLGGSRDNNRYLGTHWARRGYAAVFLQHPGSDEAVWKDARPLERLAAMQKAASAGNLRLRCEDVAVGLDALATWNTTTGHECHGRFDLEHIGMSGHSFGAITTQGVAGQSMPLIGAAWTDPRIDAALPMSPSGARGGGNRANPFAKVSVPWMLMTGTEDSSPISDQTAASRLEVFPYLPTTTDRYELVLDGAEHAAFSERGLPGDRHQRNPNHHRVILALSTAFWDAHLRGDAEAKQWLHGAGAKSVLQPKDRWQFGERSPAAAGTAK